MKEKFEGCILGFVLGDVLGDPVENLDPMEIRRRYGILREPIGKSCGTDDTKMMRIVMRSIIERGKYDPKDVAKRYKEWLPKAERIGMTTAAALSEIRLEDLTYGARKAREQGLGYGNGPLMRMPPISLLHFWDEDPEALIRDSFSETILTHYTPEAVTGAVIYSLFLVYLGHGMSPESCIERIYSEIGILPEEWLSYEVLEEAEGALNVNLEALRSCDAKGYVVNALRIAIASSFEDSFQEPILQIVNLGGDTDTNAAVAGAVLGIKLGVKALPKDWLQYVEGFEEILEEIEKLYEISLKNSSQFSEG